MEEKMHRQATSGKLSTQFCETLSHAAVSRLQFTQVSLVLETYGVRKLKILPISQYY